MKGGVWTPGMGPVSGFRGRPRVAALTCGRQHTVYTVRCRLRGVVALIHEDWMRPCQRKSLAGKEVAPGCGGRTVWQCSS